MNPLTMKTMLNKEKLERSMENPTVASVVLSGSLFNRFLKENESELADEYLDFINEVKKTKGMEMVSYPMYCYAVFNKIVIEGYLESDGL